MLKKELDFANHLRVKHLNTRRINEISINYSIDGIRLTLGVYNLFDQSPPFSVGTFNPQGFNTQFYSMRGRMIYGRITVSK